MKKSTATKLIEKLEKDLKSSIIKTISEEKRSATIVDESGITYQLEEGEIPIISTARSPNDKFPPNLQVIQNFIAHLLKTSFENVVILASMSQIEADFIIHSQSNVNVNRQTYVVDLISYVETGQFVPISVHVPSHTVTDFGEMMNPSREVTEFIKKYFSFQVAIKSEQRSNTHPDIVRAVLNLYSFKGIEKVILEFDMRQEKLLKITYHNKGFFSKPIANEKVFRANGLVIKQLKNFGFEDPGTILAAEVREIENKGEIKIYYEFPDFTLSSVVGFQADEFWILELQRLNSQIGRLKERIRNQTIEAENKVKQDPQFQTLQQTLFRMYKHYLSDASITAVAVEEMETKKVFTVFYKNERGYFKAILLYDNQIESGRILTFTIPHRN